MTVVLGAKAVARSVPVMERVDVADEIAHLESALMAEYVPTVPRHIVISVVNQSVEAICASGLHHFVPLAVERQARRELAQWVASKGVVRRN